MHSEKPQPLFIAIASEASALVAIGLFIATAFVWAGIAARAI